MSIAALVQECFGEFKKVQQESPEIESGQDKYRVDDEFGRFKVWCGNLSAHRSSGNRSLEFRLRDSSSLKDQVEKLLGALRNTLIEVQQKRHGRSDSGEDTAEEDDESLDFEYDELALQPIHPLQRLHNSLNLLYRFSITLRFPARHNRIVNGPSGVSDSYLPFDLDRIRSKYPKAEQVLQERLAKAMATRRSYLKYREDHHAKLAAGLENEVPDEVNTEREAQSTVATSIRANQPEVNIPMLSEETESVYSLTSFALTESESGHLRPPPVPEAGQDGDPFECPICYGIQQQASGDMWIPHVYEDLQPYSCTVTDCDSGHSLYSRRRDWQRHQMRAHGNVWVCLFGCAGTHATSSALEAHLIATHDYHEDNITLPRILDASTQPSRVDRDLSCPLCEKVLGTVNLWFKHVGRHMEQLALASLPSHLIHYEDEVEEDPGQMRASVTGTDVPTTTVLEDVQPINVEQKSDAAVSSNASALEEDDNSVKRHIRDTAEAFKQFSNQERQRITDMRSSSVRDNKRERLEALKKFSTNFKLSTPVPSDLLPILAKDSETQVKLQRKAEQNARDAAAKQKDSGEAG